MSDEEVISYLARVEERVVLRVRELDFDGRTESGNWLTASKSLEKNDWRRFEQVRVLHIAPIALDDKITHILQPHPVQESMWADKIEVRDTPEYDKVLRQKVLDRLSYDEKRVLGLL